MAIVGAILGIIGSTIFLIVGLYTISMARLFYTPPDFPIITNYITGITNIALGSLGIVGVGKQPSSAWLITLDIYPVRYPWS